jgi:hypothetical protein
MLFSGFYEEVTELAIANGSQPEYFYLNFLTRIYKNTTSKREEAIRKYILNSNWHGSIKYLSRVTARKEMDLLSLTNETPFRTSIHPKLNHCALITSDTDHIADESWHTSSALVKRASGNGTKINFDLSFILEAKNFSPIFLVKPEATSIDQSMVLYKNYTENKQPLFYLESGLDMQNAFSSLTRGRKKKTKEASKIVA